MEKIRGGGRIVPHKSRWKVGRLETYSAPPSGCLRGGKPLASVGIYKEYKEMSELWIRREIGFLCFIFTNLEKSPTDRFKMVKRKRENVSTILANFEIILIYLTMKASGKPNNNDKGARFTIAQADDAQWCWALTSGSCDVGPIVQARPLVAGFVQDVAGVTRRSLLDQIQLSPQLVPHTANENTWMREIRYKFKIAAPRA